jgi:uncharacterized damage-inducible protein DinB
MTHPNGEATELLQILAEQRGTLLVTVREIDDEQAARRTTVSDLTLGGVLKHVARTEAHWVEVLTGRSGRREPGVAEPDWSDQYYLREGETLAELLDEYAAAARATEEAVSKLPDLDVEVPLPDSPWWPPNTSWTARRVLLWILRETAHHSGHADIIRESLDGATTMKMPDEPETS